LYLDIQAPNEFLAVIATWAIHNTTSASFNAFKTFHPSLDK